MLGSNSFATYLIVGPTCFLLGILFTNWPYDFALLWNSSPISESMLSSIEDHYSILYNAPRLISHVLHFIILIGISGFIIKLYRPSESNALFDGASLVLFMIAVVMYGTNLLKGFMAIDARDYGTEVPRVDSLQVVAATNTICALVLAGVLTLQAGQWYAEKKEREEKEKFEKEDKDGKVEGKEGKEAEKKGAKSSGNGRGRRRISKKILFSDSGAVCLGDFSEYGRR